MNSFSTISKAIASALLFVAPIASAHEPAAGKANEIFSCTAQNGDQATLALNNTLKQGVWIAGNVTSRVTFSNIEEAPFSEQKGFWVYMLNDLEISNDSSYNLAIDFEAYDQGSESVSLVTYFDNDGHNEEEAIFICHVSKMDSAH